MMLIFFSLMAMDQVICFTYYEMGFEGPVRGVDG